MMNGGIIILIGFITVIAIVLALPSKVFSLSDRKPKTDQPASPNPAATADIEALRKAIQILRKTELELFADNQPAKGSPEWWFVVRAGKYLEQQHEDAFRWASGWRPE